MFGAGSLTECHDPTDGRDPVRVRMLAVAAALALWPWAAGAQNVGMADLDDFKLDSGQDLVDLCAVEAGDELYTEATLFCLGVLEGMIQYHDAVGRGPDGDLIVCPEGEVTRSEAVAVFVTWAKANPDQAASEAPADAVIAAALDKWGPCQQ